MNWKRGILLAAINLAAAVPMMVLLDARDVRQMVTHPEEILPVSQLEEHRGFVLVDEEETVEFDPCLLWGDDPVEVNVVQFGNLPAWFVTGWRLDCPAKWSVAGRIMGTHYQPLTRQRLAAQRRVDLWLCALIAAQWLLVGSFPLTKRRRIWQEPGSLITSCSVIGCLLALISAIDVLAKAPALVAGLAWLWWAGLLLWTGAQSGGRLVLRRWRRAA